jgi:hypothetical protein
MPRRKWTVLVGSVILLTVGAELAARRWQSAKGCVQIVNEGEGPLDDLVVRYSETSVALGRLAVGQSAKAWFTHARRGVLSLDFKQMNNALKGFQIQEFDPEENARNGVKLVLIIKSNQVQQFMEDDESTTSVQNLSDRIREWLRP